MQSKGLSRVFSNTTVQKHQFLVTFNYLSVTYFVKYDVYLLIYFGLCPVLVAALGIFWASLSWHVGSIPGFGTSPREGNGNPLHYSHLKNPIDRRDWWATVRGAAKNWTQPSIHTWRNTACGILVHQPRIKPRPPHWKADFQPLDYQGSPYL